MSFVRFKIFRTPLPCWIFSKHSFHSFAPSGCKVLEIEIGSSEPCPAICKISCASWQGPHEKNRATKTNLSTAKFFNLKTVKRFFQKLRDPSPTSLRLNDIEKRFCEVELSRVKSRSASRKPLSSARVCKWGSSSESLSHKIPTGPHCPHDTVSGAKVGERKTLV